MAALDGANVSYMHEHEPKGGGGIHVVSEGVDGEGWFLYQQKRLMNAFDTLPLQKKRRWGGGGEWKRARHQAGGVGP